MAIYQPNRKLIYKLGFFERLMWNGTEYTARRNNRRRLVQRWLVGCVFLSTRSHLNVNACLRYYCFCFNRVIVVFVCYCCVHVAAAAAVTFFLFIAHALPISCHDNITFLGILFHFNNLIVRLLKKKHTRRGLLFVVEVCWCYRWVVSFFSRVVTSISTVHAGIIELNVRTNTNRRSFTRKKHNRKHTHKMVDSEWRTHFNIIKIKLRWNSRQTTSPNKTAESLSERKRKRERKCFLRIPLLKVDTAK